MKKILILSFLLGFSIVSLSQNLNSEFRYLSLVKTQSKQLIKDNLRNAEIVSDSLIYSKTENKQLASLFFMALGDNYSLINKSELAIFSFLRQRFIFPNDSISLYVEKQIRINALRLNIEKQMVDYLIQKSAPHNLSANAETNLNNLIYWTSKIETKNLTSVLLHQIDLMNVCGIPQFDYLLKWEDLSRMAIPIKYKINYLNNEFSSLSLYQKQLYYKYQTKYYLKQKAWDRAKSSLNTLNNLNPKKPSKYICLKIRTNWHF